MWRQGDREGALDWLASLDANQQRDLQRVMSAMGTARPMLDRMARARDFSEQQYARAGVFTSQQLHRASEFTEQQVTRATEFGQQQWNRASEFGQQQLNRATEYGQQQLNRASEFGQQQVNRASEFGQQQWNRAGQGLTALRDKAKETKDRVVSSVSRWWDQRRGASTTRSAMMHAAFTASRQDPEVLRTIQQTGTTAKELKQLNELMSTAMYSPDAQARKEAFDQLTQTWEQLNGQTPQQGQNAQDGGKHRAGPGNEVTAAWINAGQPSASQAVIAQKQASQGEAQKTGGQSQVPLNKNPEQGR
jgi:hypothetical protein